RHRSRLAVLALPILLGACALPASFTIATLAIDGISYATSGKSVSDHALSAVANEDCAMWRVLQARPICRDADVPETMVAAAPEVATPPGVAAAPAPEESPEESKMLAIALGVAPAAGGPVAPEIPVASATEFGEFEVTAAAFAATLVVEESPEESKMPAAVLGVAPAAGGSTVPETARLPKLYGPSPEGYGPQGGGQAVTASAANGTTAMAAIKPGPMPARLPKLYGGQATAPADRETAAERVKPAILAAPSPEMEAKPKLGHFFVLGSYLLEARARVVMKRGRDFAPRIVRVRIHGKLFHRVVSGPYARSSIATMRRTLIAEGFRDAWIARLCQNNLRRAPCPTTLAPLNIANDPPAS
ncbi:MAG: hypothetical protein IID53_17105, partial [Proteobacteria bacterium]|nr:hypothetical protein [Pseudomonadota bacterium]